GTCCRRRSATPGSARGRSSSPPSAAGADSRAARATLLPMPVTVVVAFRAKPGRAEELVRWLREKQPKLQRFDGFLSIVLARDEEDADRSVEIERWDSAAHHRAMVEEVAAAGGWNELDALTEAEPEVSYLAELASHPEPKG